MPAPATGQAQALRELLDQRIAVLDGAWGTMLQSVGLSPDDYRTAGCAITRGT